MSWRTAFLLGFAWFVGSVAYSALVLRLAWPDPEPPIIDVHLNYHRNAWSRFQPNEIIQTLEQLHVTHAVVSSHPNEGTLILLRQAGARVIPMLSLEQKGFAWLENEQWRVRLRQELGRANYRGVGKVDIPASASDAEAVAYLVRFAVEHALVLYVNTDASTIVRLFTIDSRARILWAHAGVAATPAVIGGLLERFPNLYVELSHRTDIAPNGRDVAPAWLALFERNPDRFMLGSGTSDNALWQRLHYTLMGQRRWLQRLAPRLAEQIASENAAALFIPDSASAVSRPCSPPALCSATARAEARCPPPSAKPVAETGSRCPRDRKSSSGAGDTHDRYPIA